LRTYQLQSRGQPKNLKEKQNKETGRE